MNEETAVLNCDICGTPYSGGMCLKCYPVPEKTPKIYEAVAMTRKVYVHPRDGTQYELEHRVQHSPDGFSWGYFGSGCAELARCMLWDFLGHEPAPEVYQKFKEDHVSRFRMDQNWTMGSDSIKAWFDKEKLSEKFS